MAARRALRTLVDKCVHYHNKKIYACFVDFKKAFDSVWHDKLLFKLLQINVGGCFYNFIKSLYSNFSCSIKIGNSQTRSFQSVLSIRKRGTPRLYIKPAVIQSLYQ